MLWSCPSSTLVITYGHSRIGKSSARLSQPTLLSWSLRVNFLWKHRLILAQFWWLTWGTGRKELQDAHSTKRGSSHLLSPSPWVLRFLRELCFHLGRENTFPFEPLPSYARPMRAAKSQETFQRRWKKLAFIWCQRKVFYQGEGITGPQCLSVFLSVLCSVCVWEQDTLTSAFENSCDLTTNCYCSFDFISKWQCLGRSLPSADALCGRRSAGTGVFPW